MGHGVGYAYPHDDPRGVLTQQYAPDDVSGREYYRPSGHGAERALVERVARLRTVVRSNGDPGASPPAISPGEGASGEER